MNAQSTEKGETQVLKSGSQSWTQNSQQQIQQSQSIQQSNLSLHISLVYNLSKHFWQARQNAFKIQKCTKFRVSEPVYSTLAHNAETCISCVLITLRTCVSRKSTPIT